ncbi:hypothetical protein SteCoe_10743 [Stentor coeruleus]|uniref:Uncharacterized protein n=1 Tax=Stentor coeruleus TaxID=5963 RepID=A0A1R2CEY7_9CILI|nr:hypothetical protein SteCoe_10743 [Stentor coeruleus]
MKFSEDFEKDNSWISISSIKKAANISAVIETFQSETTLPLNLSTSSNWEIHEKSLESICNTSINQTYTAKESCKTPSYSSLLKKILILNEELSILSSQLHFANKEIERLSTHIEKQEKSHTIKIQFMQEQHEKRLQKSKADLDFLLKDLNMKSAALLAEEFLKKHSEEVQELKNFYEQKIEEMKNTHESELIFKELEQEKSVNGLKQRFFIYLAEIEKRFNKQLVELKNEYNRDWVLGCKDFGGKWEEDQQSDEERSTINDYDCDKYKKTSGSYKEKCGHRIKISISELVERLSCESCLSTRRDSR